MFTSPLPDGYTGLLMLFIAGSVWLYWAIPAVFVEAWLLHILLPTKVWRAFFESVAANVISTFFGIVAGAIVLGVIQSSGGSPSSETADQILVGGVFILWLESVLLEGWALAKWQKAVSESRVWTVAFIMNCVSYVLGYAVVFGAIEYIRNTNNARSIVIFSAVPFAISVIISSIKQTLQRQTTEQ